MLINRFLYRNLIHSKPDSRYSRLLGKGSRRRGIGKQAPVAGNLLLFKSGFFLTSNVIIAAGEGMNKDDFLPHLIEFLLV
jgi:hypothetical protein